MPTNFNACKIETKYEPPHPPGDPPIKKKPKQHYTCVMGIIIILYTCMIYIHLVLVGVNRFNIPLDLITHIEGHLSHTKCTCVINGLCHMCINSISYIY